MKILALLLLSLLCEPGISETSGNGLPTLMVKSTGRSYRDRIQGVDYERICDERRWIDALYSEKDFHAIEHRIAELLNRASDDEKAYSLYLLYNSLGRIGNKIALPRRLKTLDEWCRTRGTSYVPWLVRGHFYLDYAWQVRGPARARNVPEDVWPEFYRLLSLARSDLEKAAAMNPPDPNAFSSLIELAKGLGLPRQTMEGHFRRGAAILPWDYGLHCQKFYYLTPRWHGREKDMFEFARQCERKSEQHPYLGLMLVYALDDPDNNNDGNALGKDSNWRIIQRIYNRFFDKYPENVRRRFFYAYHAYKAKKYDVALRQFEIIGDRWTEDTFWRSLEQYNECRAFVLYRRGYELVWKRKVYDKAIHYLEESVRCVPSADAFYSLGIAYWQRGNAERNVGLLLKSEEALARAVELAPGHAEAGRQLNELRRQFELYGR